MKRAFRVSIGVLALAALILAWMVLAPPGLGGSAEYVITHGSSMEPKLHEGDLAVVRSGGDHEAGDVVAYRSRALRQIVLHRIVRSEGDRFVTKGDSNRWVDSEQPVNSDVIGRLWFSVPAGGKVLRALQVPRNAAFAVAVLALLALGGTGAQVRRRRARRRTDELGEDSLASVASAAHALWPFVAAAGAICLAFALIAFSRPGTRAAPVDLAYEQTASFSYAAKAPSRAAYENRAVETGDPVFLRLVDRLPVRFIYALESNAPLEVGATTRLTAELSDESGWRRSIPLGSEASSGGSSLVAEGTIDFPRLWRLLRRVQAETGIAQESYDLTLAANVAVDGRLAGKEVEERFAPRVHFRLDALKLQVVSDAGDSSDGVQSLFTSSRAGSVEVSRTEPAPITLLGHSLNVGDARLLGLGGAGLMAALLAGLLLLGARRNEPDRIRAAHGSLLVPLAGGVGRLPEDAADVATMDALVRIARSGGRMILHVEQEGVHTYLVHDDGPAYRYTAFESEEARASRETRKRPENGNGNGNGHHTPPREQTNLLPPLRGLGDRRP
jgi:signal peptidase I